MDGAAGFAGGLAVVAVLALALAPLPARTSSPVAAAATQRVDAGAAPRSAGSNAAADVYVEARLRPLSAGASGALYVIGRQRDDRNWYGAGLNFLPASGRMQIEIVRMQDGQLTRLKQFNRAAAADARFNTVRLEMSGATLTAYLDGERISSVVDTVLALAGGYGVVAIGAPFETSMPVTGSAADKPARLALARAPQRVQLSVGDGALRLPVSALGPFRLASTAAADTAASTGFLTPGAVQDAAAAAAANGARPLRFTAVAAQPALVTAQVNAGALVLTPRAAGATTVTLAAVDDPNVRSVVEVNIAAASAPRAGGSVAGAVVPAPGAGAVPFDTPLRLRFDQPPVPGQSGGAIRIYRQRDGALVDTIRTGVEADLLGHAGQPLRRAVRRQLVTIAAREAIIHPHGAALAPDEGYLVTVDDGVFQGAIDGRPFAGVTRAQGWTFRTGAALPADARTLVVDDDGVADFRTVQGALDYAMGRTARAAPVTVEIRDGSYRELLYLRGKDNVTLRGQSRDGVVIEAANSDGVNPGSGTAQDAQSPGITGGRALLLVEDADLLTIERLTLRNSALRASPTGGQAEALFFNSEGRLVVKEAALYSEQDTVQVRGYAWFYRTLVAGNVDFIWGNNRAALFEDSELRTVGDSGSGKSGGYLLQARTVAAADRGFLFVDSRLTHGPGPTGNDVPPGTTWLARSPGYATTWDHVAFINCRMGPHIAAAGWAGPDARQPAPNPAAAGPQTGWREYGSTTLDGQPLDLGARQHGRVLTATEAQAAYSTRAQFFANFQNGRGWNPQ